MIRRHINKRPERGDCTWCHSPVKDFSFKMPPAEAYAEQVAEYLEMRDRGYISANVTLEEHNELMAELCRSVE